MDIEIHEGKDVANSSVVLLGDYNTLQSKIGKLESQLLDMAEVLVGQSIKASVVNGVPYCSNCATYVSNHKNNKCIVGKAEQIIEDLTNE